MLEDTPLEWGKVFVLGSEKHQIKACPPGKVFDEIADLQISAGTPSNLSGQAWAFAASGYRELEVELLPPLDKEVGPAMALVPLNRIYNSALPAIAYPIQRVIERDYSFRFEFRFEPHKPRRKGTFLASSVLAVLALALAALLAGFPILPEAVREEATAWMTGEALSPEVLVAGEPGASRLSLRNLPSTSGSQDLQIWLLGPDSKVIFSKIIESTEGAAELVFPDKEMPEVSFLEVSLEPKGGSANPSGKLVLRRSVN